MEQERKHAYHLSNRVLCYRLCNDTPTEYDYLYEKTPIIELYRYAAIRMAANKLRK